MNAKRRTMLRYLESMIDSNDTNEFEIHRPVFRAYVQDSLPLLRSRLIRSRMHPPMVTMHQPYIRIDAPVLALQLQMRAGRVLVDGERVVLIPIQPAQTIVDRVRPSCLWFWALVVAAAGWNLGPGARLSPCRSRSSA